MPLPNSWQFEAIGTSWKIDSAREFSNEIKQVVSERIEQFDTVYSRFRDDSVIARIAQTSGVYTFDDTADFERLFGLYSHLYDVTHGSVTPLIAQNLVDAGYDKDYQLKSVTQFVPPKQLNQIVSWDGASTITTTEPVLLDFGAAGKGLLADIVTNLLVKLGYDDIVVDASGDIVHHSATRFTIGLEDPNDSTRVIGSVTLQNESLCSSAINRRNWGDFHHVVDGRSGKPTDSFIATWVIAKTGLVADGLATALFFVQDPDELAEYYNLAYLRIGQTGTIEMNESMRKRVTLFT